MSHREFLLWLSWRRLNGPVCQQLRSDWQTASVCQSFVGGTLEDHRLKFRSGPSIEELNSPEYSRDLMRKISMIFGSKGSRSRKTWTVHRTVKR